VVTSILLIGRMGFAVGADEVLAGTPAAGFGRLWHLVSGQL